MSAGAAGVVLEVGAKLASGTLETIFNAFKELASRIATMLKDALTLAFSAVIDGLKTIIVGGVVSATAALTGVIVIAGQLEQKFLDIRKVLNVSADGFEKMKTILRDTASELAGMPIERLLKAAEIGASAGIEPNKLTEFAKQISIGSVALGIDSDALATKMVQLSKIFKLPIDESKNFIAALNELENKTTATAQEIFNITNRMAGSAAQAGLFAHEAAALGTAMNQAGVSSEIAGTALTKFLDRLQNQGVLENAAKAVGMQVDAFKQLKAADPVQAIIKLAEAFKRLPQGKSEEFLGMLGFNDARYKAAIGKLFAQVDDIKKNLIIAERGFVLGISAGLEYAIRSDSLIGLWEQMKNRIELMGEALGNRVMPGVKDFVKSIGQLANIIRDSADIWGPWMDSISKGFSTIASLIRNPAQGLGIIKSYLQEIWDNIPAQALSALDAIMRAVLGLLKGIAMAITGMFEMVFEALSYKLQGVLEAMKGPLADQKQIDLSEKFAAQALAGIGPKMMANFQKAFGEQFAGFKWADWMGRGAERAPLWRQIAGNDAFRVLQEEGMRLIKGAQLFGEVMMNAAELFQKKKDRAAAAADMEGEHALTPEEIAQINEETEKTDRFIKEVMALMGAGEKHQKPFTSEIMDPESLWKRIQEGGPEQKILDVNEAILKVNQKHLAEAELFNKIQARVADAVEKGVITVE